MTIYLPTTPAPNGMSPSLMDFGIIQRPATGGKVQKVQRLGSRFRVAFSFPPMKGEVARSFIARLLRAKRGEGLRMKFPLLDTDQSGGGAPVVNGAGQSGMTLNVRGATAGFRFEEGFWISIVDASGQRYLHNITSLGVANGAGQATLQIEPALREPFLDGATVMLAPEIDGFIDGEEWGWNVDVARIYGIQFTLEEWS